MCPWVTHLIEQELIQVLELVGVGDLAEHRLPPLLGHCDFADLEVSVLLPFASWLLGVLLPCCVAVLVARGGWSEKEWLARWVLGRQGHKHRGPGPCPASNWGCQKVLWGLGGGWQGQPRSPRNQHTSLSQGTLAAPPSIPEAASDQPSRFFLVAAASGMVCTVFSVSSTPSRLDFLSLFLCKKSLLKVDL